MIDELAGDACRWFLDHTHLATGLVRDRAANLNPNQHTTEQASISAVGFYLSLLPEIERRGLLSRDAAAASARKSIDFVAQHVDHVCGILPHFLDCATGHRWRNSEYSVLDTSIFLHGCITACGAYSELTRSTDALLDRVEWTKLWAFSERWGRWLLSYGFAGGDKSLLSSAADVRSAENLMPCLLAAGSRTHPLGPECWYHARIDRAKDGQPLDDLYSQLRGRVINPSHPLFTSQYGLLWADLHDLHDADGIDLAANARDASLMNRAYCRQIAAKKFRTYGPADGGWWGLSAGDGPHGYVAPGPVDGDPDGTAWPTAALASVQWIEDTVEADLRAWRAGPKWTKVRGKYGLAPFSTDRNWIGNDLIGIDLGCFASAAVNARDNSIHRLWSSHAVARGGVQKLEFSSTRG